MKRYETQANGKTIWFNAEEDVFSAEFFLELLGKQEQECRCVEDEAVLQIGWSAYRVKKDEDAENSYQLIALDYQKDPFTDNTEDLTLSIALFGQMTGVCKELKAMSRQQTTFQDRIMISKKAREEGQLFLLRQEEKHDNDCGWYLGCLSEEKPSHDPEDFEMVYTYELINICSMAIGLLNLPVGYMAIIVNDTIMSIANENNEEVYNAAE